MIIAGDSLASHFDVLMESDYGLHLNNQRLGRWRSKCGNVFLDQEAVLHQPLFIPGSLNRYPTINFKGLEWMTFKGLYAPSGPHTFVIVCKPRAGLLFDCQHGPVSMSAIGLPNEWQVLQFVTASSAPLNRACALGSNYYGTGQFFNGQLALFAYKNGLLTQAQTKYIIETLQSKYTIGDTACDTWYSTLRRLPRRIWTALTTHGSEE